MTAENTLLSLIIPAYNEAGRLPLTLPKVAEFIEAQPYQAEVIIIDNNSSDDTGRIAREFAAEFPFMSVLDEPRQGKGAAVRTGMMAAKGDYLFMADADFSMPVDEVRKFLPPQLGDYDVAIGSREAPGAVRYEEPEYRHVMGRVFNFIVSVLAVPGFQDTQCGFKAFRRDVARDLFARQHIDGWAFDVEVLFMAQRRNYRIVEVPVHWYYMANSRISPIKDSLNMLWQVLKIRYDGWRGRYD